MQIAEFAESTSTAVWYLPGAARATMPYSSSHRERRRASPSEYWPALRFVEQALQKADRLVVFALGFEQLGLGVADVAAVGIERFGLFQRLAGLRQVVLRAIDLGDAQLKLGSRGSSAAICWYSLRASSSWSEAIRSARQAKGDVLVLRRHLQRLTQNLGRRFVIVNRTRTGRPASPGSAHWDSCWWRP